MDILSLGCRSVCWSVFARHPEYGGHVLRPLSASAVGHTYIV